MRSITLRTTFFIAVVLVLPCWVAACSGGDDSTAAGADAGMTTNDASAGGDVTIPGDANDTTDADDFDARMRREGGRGDAGRRRDGGEDDGGDDDAALDSDADAG